MVKAKKHELLVRFPGTQCSNYNGIGVHPGGDRKPRQHDAGKFRNGGLACGQPFGVHRGEIDDEPRHGERLERNAPDSEPAHLDQAREGPGRAHQQAAVRGLDMDAIVADEPGEWQGMAARLNEREGEA